MIKKLLVGIALLGAFSFASAQTNAGIALRNWVGTLSDEQIKCLIRRADGVGSPCVLGPSPFVLPTITVSVGGTHIGDSINWVKGATTGLGSIDAWRDWNENNPGTKLAPFGATSPWQPYWACEAKDGSGTIEWGFSRSPASSTTWNNRVGWKLPGDTWTWAQGPSAPRQISSTNLQQVNDQTITRQQELCIGQLTLSQWLDGTGGLSPRADTPAAVRGGIQQWIATVHDRSQVYAPPSGINHSPALTAAQAAQCDQACQDDTGAPPGIDTGGGGSTIDSNTTAGACSQIAGNWFTNFWENIENTGICLWVPEFTFAERFEQTKELALEKAPFGYYTWLDPGGVVLCNYGVITGENGTGNISPVTALEDGSCWSGQLTLRVPHPTAEGGQWGLAFTIWDNPAFDWWFDYGVHILFYVFAASFFIWVIKQVIA